MPVVFSDHARKQLKQRKVSIKKAKETVVSPDNLSASFRGRKLRDKNYRGKILRIVTVAEGSKITVVTGYYIRRKI